MLWDVEPSVEVTGGAWYNEHELDEGFISILHNQCLLYINNKVIVCNMELAVTSL